MMTTLYSLNKINKFFVYSNGVDIASCLSSIDFLFLFHNRMLTQFMYVFLSYTIYTSGKFDPNLNSKDGSDWTRINPISLLNDQLKNKFVIQCCPAKCEVGFSDIFQGNFSLVLSLCKLVLFLLQNMSKGMLSTSSHSTI